MTSKGLIIENKIIDLYTIDKMTITGISKKLNITRRWISSLLKSKGFKILKKDRIYKKRVFTDKDLKISSNNGKMNIGKKKSKVFSYKNMTRMLRYDVDYDWIIQFEDIEKLKFLNNAVKKSGIYNFDTQLYMNYILRFYYDDKFNNIYNKWINNNYNKWLRPSLDHINPRKNNELDDMDNLEFLTWFENRTKTNISSEDWKRMKENITFYLT